MLRDARPLLVAAVYVAGVALAPGLFALLVLLASLFVAGCLFPERPVAAATMVTVLGLLPCAVLLAFLGFSGFAGSWYSAYPVEFELALISPWAIGDLIVRAFATWGWAVVAAYMGAGVVFRVRIRRARRAPA